MQNIKQLAPQSFLGVQRVMWYLSAKFETLGGDSDALIGKLKTLSIELNGAADTAELTGAAYDVASAGFTDAADAAMILKAASLGATGGFTDINTAGGAAVKVLNAYGMGADQAASLMDKFAQTQADGIITIGQYSQNIGKVATTAAGLKVPLEEVNAVIAQSTAAGTNIETAFSGLNSALAKISSGQAGKKLGIDLNEATLRTEGLAGALKKLEGFSTGELQEAFGIEAFKGIQVAVEDTEKLNKLIANQAESQGRAKEAADSMKVTSNDLYEMGIADKILKEPIGGAHHDINEMAHLIKTVVTEEINNLKKISTKDLINLRLEKYNKIGVIEL